MRGAEFDGCHHCITNTNIFSTAQKEIKEGVCCLTYYGALQSPKCWNTHVDIFWCCCFSHNCSGVKWDCNEKVELLQKVHCSGTSVRWCQITTFFPPVFPTFAAASSFPGLETDSENKTLSFKASWKIKGGDEKNVRDLAFFFSLAFKLLQHSLIVLFNAGCSSHF